MAKIAIYPYAWYKILYTKQEVISIRNKERNLY